MAREGNGILSTAAPGAPLLVADGSPVWPVADDSEHRHLHTATDHLGLALVDASDPSPGGLDPDPRRGEVVGIGGGVLDDTRLYAHLTGRRWRVVERVGDLAVDGHTPEVVVCDTASVDAQLLTRLYDEQSLTRIPGVVCGRTPAALRRRVLTSAAMVAGAAGGPAERVELLTLEPMGRYRYPGREVLGERVDPTVLDEVLTRRLGMLSIYSHFDGMDVYLGPHRTLCPMDAPDPSADRVRAPRCFETGFCHRHRLGVDEGFAAGHLRAPESLRATVLVLEGCKSVVMPDDVLDPAWGLLERLVASPTVGAVVTGWEIVRGGPGVTAALADAIAHGRDVGTAVAGFARGPVGRRLGFARALFGDPRVRPGPRPGRRRRPPADPPAVRRDPTSLADVALLRAVVAAPRPSPSEVGDEVEARRQVAVSAIEAVESAERALWSGRPLDGERGSPGPQLRSSVLDYLVARRALAVNVDLFDVSDARAVGVGGCPACDTPARGHRLDPRVAGGSRRRVVICPRCSFAVNSPDRSDLVLRLDQPWLDGGASAELLGCLPAGPHWEGRLVVQSKLATEQVLLSWPADGVAPARRARLPETVPPGQLEVSLLLVDGAALSILTQPAHGVPVGARELVVSPVRHPPPNDPGVPCASP